MERHFIVRRGVIFALLIALLLFFVIAIRAVNVRTPHPPFGHLLPAMRGEGTDPVVPSPREAGRGWPKVG
jgi:hypothetical protein